MRRRGDENIVRIKTKIIIVREEILVQVHSEEFAHPFVSVLGQWGWEGVSLRAHIDQGDLTNIMEMLLPFFSYCRWEMIFTEEKN
jgi:hypothetical protein